LLFIRYFRDLVKRLREEKINKSELN